MIVTQTESGLRVFSYFRFWIADFRFVSS